MCRMSEFIERVSQQATQVRPLKVLLTVVSLPFYLVGLLVGCLWVVVVFAYAAVKVGVEDARNHADRQQPKRANPGGSD